MRCSLLLGRRPGCTEVLASEDAAGAAPLLTDGRHRVPPRRTLRAMNPDAPVRHRDRATWRDIVVAVLLAVLAGAGVGYLVGNERSQQHDEDQIVACQRVVVADMDRSGPGNRRRVSPSTLRDQGRCLEGYDEKHD